MVKDTFPELTALEQAIDLLDRHARVEVLEQVSCGPDTFPVYAISLGATAPESPTLGVFGGVHGLERIGTQVVLSYLRTLAELLSWDESMRLLLEKVRLIFMPLINPAGMMLKRRSNPNGVDLMRNSPVEGESIPRYHLFSGHRLSPRLPWYQGKAGGPMEPEAEAVCRFVRREIFSAKVAVTVDVHSGYGAIDRLWFPYAKTKRPFPHLGEACAIKALLDRTYPNHIYRVEPQAREYTTHGDLWDYLYDEYRRENERGVYLPLALEMGSWLWIRKNFRQAFSFSLLGAFNPMALHRQQRILRRHLLLFEFLLRAVLSPNGWAFLSETERHSHRARALELWYGA